MCFIHDPSAELRVRDGVEGSLSCSYRSTYVFVVHSRISAFSHECCRDLWYFRGFLSLCSDFLYAISLKMKAGQRWRLARLSIRNGLVSLHVPATEKHRTNMRPVWEPARNPTLAQIFTQSYLRSCIQMLAGCSVLCPDFPRGFTTG